jgi:hypothetical protein
MPTINHLLNRCAICLCLVALLVLSACGPGTGGTGTGPSAGASPIPFAGSYFTSGGVGTVTAAPLPNPSTTPTVSPTTTTSLPAPTCTTSCANNLDGQAISLHVQADRIVLSTPCATFTYAGVWSVSATGETTVQGVLESSTVANGQASRSSQNASLTLGFPNSVDGSGTVTVSIKDSTGKLLFGPATLQRAATVPASVNAGGC